MTETRSWSLKQEAEKKKVKGVGSDFTPCAKKTAKEGGGEKRPPGLP